jgi:Cu+-exporting ATPase
MGTAPCPGHLVATAALAARQQGLTELLTFSPCEGRNYRQADGSDVTVQVDAIQVGDLLRVRPGEKVPVDGEFTGGRGNVDDVDGHG